MSLWLLAANFVWLLSEFCDEDDTPYLYPHAKGILNALKVHGIDVAIASRSPTSEIARTLLDKLGLRSMFVAEVKAFW